MTSLSDVVDTKLIGKPPRFKGAETEWMQWSFIFENYVALVRADFLPFLEEAAGHEEPIDMEALGDVAKATSQNIYILLSQFLEGQRLRMTMLVKGRNGLEVWRQLKQKYEPHTGSRAMGALQSVLNYKLRIAATSRT